MKIRSNTPSDKLPITEIGWLDLEMQWMLAKLERLAVQGTAVERRRTKRERGMFEESATPRPSLRVLRVKEKNARKNADEALAKFNALHGKTNFHQIAEMYQLDDFEQTVLMTAVAMAMSKKFAEDLGNPFSGLMGGSDLTPESVFRFAELSFSESVPLRKRFGSQARLIKNDLISIDIRGQGLWPDELLDASLRITSSAFNRIVGEPDLEDAFLAFSRLEDPITDIDGVVLDPSDKRRLKSIIESHDNWLKLRQDWGIDDVVKYGRGLIMLFHGAPGTGKTLMAHGVAKLMGKRVLNVDIPMFVENFRQGRFLPGLFREARLRNAVLFFDECEFIFASREQGNGLMTELLTELEKFEGTAILATNLPVMLDEALDRRILIKVKFPEPDRLARIDLWRRHLPEAVPLAPDVDIEQLADHYEISGGYIKNSVLEAVAMAASDARDGSVPILRMAHLDQSARNQSRKITSEVGASLLYPKTRLADMILPENDKRLVREIVAAARGRRTILERWQIGAQLDYGKGLAALFIGEPGTGKTMCAHAIAGEMERPLLEASMSSMLSKWVGESEKNLDGIFEHAKRENAVLFIDECDALLAERGEASAQHDDRLVSVFLRQLERHDGLVLLATNRDAALDRALSRRVTYKLKFRLPNATARTEIWRGLLPATAPVDPDIDFDALGKRFDLSGGRIRNAVFKAAFRAASSDDKRLTLKILFEAAEEEREAASGKGSRSVGF